MEQDFTVYGEEQGTERVFPYDVVPRVISNTEWTHIERGLVQRITALNMFLHDVYNEGRILAEGKVPREVVYTCRHFRREMRGLQVPRNVYIAVVGTDLLRLSNGKFVVLEDNLRVPSGVSYMLSSRRVMRRILRQPEEVICDTRWTRVVMDRECRKLIDNLGPANLDALEISGVKDQQAIARSIGSVLSSFDMQAETADVLASMVVAAYSCARESHDESAVFLAYSCFSDAQLARIVKLARAR